MAFPTGIDPTAPAGSDSPGQGDDQFRALKTLLVDWLGATAGTNNYTAARSVMLPDATLNQWPTAVRLTNNSGGALARNDVVAVVTTVDTSVAHNNVLGSLLDFVVCADATIADATAGLFWRTGVVNIATTGAVARGEYVWKSTTNKLAISTGITASATAAPPPGAFALALSAAAGDVCKVLLFGRTHQGTGMGARVTSTGATTVNDSSETTVVFDTERYDIGGIWTSGAATRLTVPVAGVYAITGNVALSTDTDYVDTYLTVRLNGATTIAWSDTLAMVAGVGLATPRIAIAAIYKLAAADYVELRAFQNNTDNSAETVTVSGNYSPEFAIHYLGA